METLLPFEKIEHEVLVKKEAETSDKFGLYPNQRSVPELINYGVVNIDKPKGPTSHQVSSYTQNILKLKKGGHAGTLDPKVTGILAVALGDATRIVQALLPAGKEYICLMHLHKEIDEYDIRKVCAEFVGKIRQLPPIKSAVKREWRYRKIYYLKIHDVIDQDVLFLVGCQAGTYIRKLCLHPHTEILSKNGLILASDFNSNPQTIYSFDKGKMIEKNPSATQKLHSPTKLIKITMASGINFIVTQDHELFYSSPEGYKMIEARKLKKGNYLVKSIKFPAITKEYVVSDLLDDKFLISQENIKERCKRAFIKKYGSIRAMNRKLKLDRKAFLSGSQNAITIKN
jgi:tRNA pseudouridine(55) synthase